MVEDWKLTLDMSNTTKIKILTVLFGVLERARKRHRLPVNPIRDVEPAAASAASGQMAPDVATALARLCEVRSRQSAIVLRE